jgi:hypothetical protein
MEIPALSRTRAAAGRPLGERAQATASAAAAPDGREHQRRQDDIAPKLPACFCPEAAINTTQEEPHP